MLMLSEIYGGLTNSGGPLPYNIDGYLGSRRFGLNSVAARLFEKPPVSAVFEGFLRHSALFALVEAGTLRQFVSRRARRRGPEPKQHIYPTSDPNR